MRTFSIFVFLSVVISLAPAQFRINVMPGYPNAPKVQSEQTHMLRPGTTCVWGNLNGGFGPIPSGATYTWVFQPNQNLEILDDGNLGGTVTDARFICEVVTFNLLNNSTRETVTATLTVNGLSAGTEAASVELEIIDPSDPQLSDVRNLQIDANIAIENGLLALYRRASISTASSGEPLVSWAHGATGNNTRAATGFALWAFQNQGHLPRAENYGEDVYAEFVQAGLNWLFNNSLLITDPTGSGATRAPRATTTLGATSATVSDMNSNTEVVQLDTSNHRGYAHAIVLAAIVASATPDQVVAVGPAAGRTYRTFAEDAIDWLGATQNQGGSSSWSGRGGWNYQPTFTSNRSDMSINSWAYVAMEGALEVFNIQVPDWIKQEIEHGLVAHQQPSGRFGYTGMNSGGSHGTATTGGGLSGLALVETASLYSPGAIIAQQGPSTLDTIAEKRAAALTWMGNNWSIGNNSSGQSYGNGNRGNFYSMWTMARALRLTASAFGLPEGETVLLKNGGVDFDWETGEVHDPSGPTGVVAAPGSAREGYFSWLVRTQNLSTSTVVDLNYGTWSGWYGRNMCTALATLILTPRVFVDSCPGIVTIPVTSVSPANNTTVSPGTQVTLSGRAVSQDPTRPILGVFINGEQVTSLDPAGNFFKTVTVQSGMNTYVIRAVDRCGASDTLHALNGGDPQVGFQNLSDVTLRAVLDYSNTTFNQNTNQLIVTARARNVGQDLIDAPLVMVIDNIPSPGVTLANPDGFTPAGKPYFVFLNPAVQSQMAPGTSSPPRIMIFNNPQQVGVVFSQSWMAPTNEAPYFVSVPPVQGAVGIAYTYGAQAFDPNGDPLAYSLQVGPQAMTVDPTTGAVAWTPAGSDLGSHQVTIQASDGRGGRAFQSYVLDVLPALPNRAPFFTSIPIAQSSVGSGYAYQASATDPDGDPLSFSVTTNPSGLTSSANGLVTWSFVQPGLHTVTLRVEDPHGGFAEQTWALAAGVPSTNPNAPLILSTAPTTAVANLPYVYQPVAIDPDPNQTLTWSLVTGPVGLSIDGVSGLITWTPGASQVGANAVEIRVDDGNGGITSQGWVVEVLLNAPNQAPQFATTPVFSVDTNTSYSYDADAIDPEGSDITYSLVVSPAGMSIDPNTGVVSWMASPLGTYAVVIRATDSNVPPASAHQAFNLSVLPPNNPPTITSSPVTLANPGVPYRYQLTVQDPDPDTHTFSLAVAPTGMTVGVFSGEIQWVPELAQIGQHTVTAHVDDGRGGVDTQSFTLDVIQDIQAPTVQIMATPSPAAVNVPVQICVQASDNIGVVSRTLTIDGNPVPLNNFHCATFVPPAAGTLTLVATASDASGNVGTTTSMLQVGNPGTGAPVITIHGPASGTVLTGPTDVFVSIEDPSMASQPPPVNWSVRLRNERTDEVRVLAMGSAYVSNQSIATIDTTLLSNDGYRLEVEANNVGFAATEPLALSVAGKNKIGHFTHDTVDLTIPVAGIPLSITRRYNSRDTSIGDFGRGWSLALNVQVSDVPREAPQVEPFRPGVTRVYVTRLDGLRVGFTADYTPSSWLFPWIGSVSFTADPGVHDELELATPESVFFSNGQLFTGLFNTPWNPARYRFKTKQGLDMVIHEVTGLEMVTDANGNTLTVTPGGIQSSTGVALSFVRDASGRISRIIEPAQPGSMMPPGEHEYAYDAAGNLTSHKDQLDNETKYFYENPGLPYHLTKIEDPLGRPFIRNVYDAVGRLLAQCGPDGNPLTLEGCTTFNTNITTGVTTIFDGRGNRIDFFVDNRGNVTKERRWLDASTSVDWDFTYDSDDNVLTEQKAAGGLWTYTYDQNGNRTSRIDPGGRAWYWVYSASNKLIVSRDPLGNELNLSYDANDNLVSMTNAVGSQWSFSYDSAGRMTTISPPVGGAWLLTYGANGFPDSLTDPRGHAETFSYDSLGRMLWRTDRRGLRVDFLWDLSGRLVQEVWDNGRAFTYDYNRAGELTLASDPQTTITTAYNNSGLPMGVNVTSNVGAPPFGMSYEYDGNGNVIEVRDSYQERTAYTYDALNRMVGLSQGSIGSTLDAAAGGFRRAEVDVDPAGVITAIRRFTGPGGLQPVADTTYTYDCTDCLHRLTGLHHRESATGTTLHQIQLVRDLAGQVTEITDAEGVHQYAHDGFGQLLSAMHPAGGVQPAEHYAYDSLGSRTSSHLSSSYSYGYAAGGNGQQLLSTDDATYEYDENGNLVRQIDTATGRELRYTYDHRNRLTDIVEMDAAMVVLHTVHRTFDPANRVVAASIDGVPYYYYYDGDNPTVILDASGAVVKRRLYSRSIDDVYAESDAAGNTRWLLRDHVGSVRDVIDESATVLRHYVYDTFGRRLAGGQAGDRAELTFNSLEFDPISGLGNYRARSYAPRVGRFTQEDPRFPFRYTFVDNAPLHFTDPSGETALIEYACLAGNAVAAGCGAYAMLRPIGDIYYFLADVMANLPNAPGSPPNFLGDLGMGFMQFGPFLAGPIIAGGNCGGFLLATAVSTTYAAGVGFPEPLPCQGVLW